MNSFFFNPPDGKEFFIKQKFDTEDIINTILNADVYAYKQSIKYAAFLKKKHGNNVLKICSEIWHFLKNKINYVADNENQVIKSPSQLVYTKKGDCKSFSLFAGSVLKCLNIDYFYRFVSFTDEKNPTHVYVIAINNKKNIIIDGVWNTFNSEKPYLNNKDYTMPKLSYIQGINNKNAFEREALNDIVDAYNNKDHKKYNSISLYLAINSSYNNSKINGFKDWIKNVVEEVAKVVTFIPRLVIKGILEVKLPKSAPAFLYLFVNDPVLLEAIGEKAQKKRYKMQKRADFIVNAIGMKRSHFLHILRKGISEHFGKSPEKVIEELVLEANPKLYRFKKINNNLFLDNETGKQISLNEVVALQKHRGTIGKIGCNNKIGFIDPVTATIIISAIISIISAISKGKSTNQDLSANTEDLPQPSDFLMPDGSLNYTKLITEGAELLAGGNSSNFGNKETLKEYETLQLNDPPQLNETQKTTENSNNKYLLALGALSLLLIYRK